MPRYASVTDRAFAQAFFADKPLAGNLFLHLLRGMEAFATFKVTATKSRVAVKARTRFLWCGEAHADGSLYIRFLLPHPIASKRLRNDAVRGRWSIRAKLRGAEDVDDELLAWIREAYEWDVAAGASPKARSGE